MTKEERGEIFYNYLKEEGYLPVFDDDQDIVFQFEGNSHILTFEEEDEIFIRIIVPSIYLISSLEERIRVIEAANFANLRAKAAKIYIEDKFVHATIELFFEEPEELLKTFFYRSVMALRVIIDLFKEKMEEGQAELLM